MQNKAVRGLMILLIGCAMAQFALLSKIIVNSNSVSGFDKMEQRLDIIEGNQKTLIARQKIAMQRLKIDDEPATQP